MKLGFIGLGKMGSRMVQKLLADGHDVIVWNRSKAPIEELQFKIQNSKFKIVSKKFKVSETVEALVKSLAKPSVVWSMLPAGEATKGMLAQLLQLVEPGDIVINGANEHFSVTEQNYGDFKEKGIRFLGIGVS